MMIFFKGQKMTVGSYCVGFFDINGGLHASSLFQTENKVNERLKDLQFNLNNVPLAIFFLGKAFPFD